MLRVILAATLLVGCGASAELGGTCSLDDPCDNAVCDFTDPAGPTCIERDGDLDGDGIPNNQDFCNHADGGRFDEDRDGIGDDCDRCPIAPPPSQPDSDNDTVDSPCDPDPSEDGDTIVVFEGFNEGIPSTLTATAGWQVMGGEAIGTPTAADVDEELTAALPLTSQTVAVVGQYRVDTVLAAATQSFAGVETLDERPAGGSEILCSGSRTGSIDRLLLVTDTGTSTKDFTNLFNTASVYRVALSLAGAGAGCAMIADEERGATQTSTNGELMNRAGLVVRGAVARFQYLLVVQRSTTGGT
ncbi:MAG: hypothetical protein ABI867_21835 [Kofleriaceae bacterium]